MKCPVERAATSPAMERHVQGLRGLAVALVVAYHVNAPGSVGGGLGVDVFFVISGYVIASSLLAETDRTGTVRLREFFARRVRRLLPVVTLVLLVTLVTYRLWWDEALRNTFRGEAQAAAVGVANLWAAYREVPYNGPRSLLVSPFTHFWSLGVEEQFYLIVAPAFVLVGKLRVGRISSARILLIVTLFVGLGSAALNVAYSRGPTPLYAFYLPDARAWELVAGLVLAQTRERWTSIRPTASLLAGWAGVVTILAAARTQAITPDRLTWGPALAVGGAALVIVGGAGDHPWRSSRLLSTRAITGLGAIAYPLYLWHVPVFAVIADRFSDIGSPRVLAIVISLMLAIVTHFCVERPMRWSPKLAARPIGTIAGGLAVAFALFLLVGPLTAARPLSERLPVRPSLDLLVEPAEQPLPRCTAKLPGRADTCSYGDPHGDRTVMLIGDSHARFWLDALDAAGQANNWRVVLEYGSACPWVDFDDPDGTFGVSSCIDARDRTIQTMTDIRPDLVVIANFYALQMVGISAEQYTNAAVRAAARFPAGTKLLVLGDVPGPPMNWDRCLIDHLDETDVCAFQRSDAMDPRSAAIVRETADRLGASYAATAAWVCPEETCRVVRDGLLLYRDRDHLTTEFSRTLGPQLADEVRRALTR